MTITFLWFKFLHNLLLYNKVVKSCIKIFRKFLKMFYFSVCERVHRQRCLASQTRLVQDLQVKERSEMGSIHALPLPYRLGSKEKGCGAILLDFSRKVFTPHRGPSCLHLPSSHRIHFERLVLGQPDLQDYDYCLHYNYGLIFKLI